MAVAGKVVEGEDKNESQLVTGSGTPRDTLASRKRDLGYFWLLNDRIKGCGPSKSETL